MKISGLRGQFWPTPTEERLLRVAVGTRSEAERAWEEVRAAIDLDGMPGPAVRLMVLVGRRLEALGIDDPVRPRLRGLYRRWWFTNQVQLEGLRRALDVLEAAGIPALLLKGGALIQLGIYDAGERPLSDTDLLVRRADVPKALELLRGAGWTVSHGLGGLPPERLLRRMHALGLRGANSELDLHWQVASDLIAPGDPGAITRRIWEAAREIDVDGRPCKVLDPAHMALHAIVHGARGRSGAHLQWVVDVTRIVSGLEERFPWDEVAATAVEGQSGLAVLDACRYLRMRGFAGVPDEALRTLRAARPSGRERLATRLNGIDGGRLGEFPQTLSRFVRETAEAGPGGTISALPAFLQVAWDLESPWQIPGSLARKVARRIGPRDAR